MLDVMAAAGLMKKMAAYAAVGGFALGLIGLEAGEASTAEYANTRLAYTVDLPNGWTHDAIDNPTDPLILRPPAGSKQNRDSLMVVINIQRGLAQFQMPESLAQFGEIIKLGIRSEDPLLDLAGAPDIHVDDDVWFVRQDYKGDDQRWILTMAVRVDTDYVIVLVAHNAMDKDKFQPLLRDMFDRVTLLPYTETGHSAAELARAIEEMQNELPGVVNAMIAGRYPQVHLREPQVRLNQWGTSVQAHVSLSFTDRRATEYLSVFRQFILSMKNDTVAPDPPSDLNVQRLYGYAGTIPMVLTGVFSYLRAGEVSVGSITITCTDDGGTVQCELTGAGANIEAAAKLLATNPEQGFVQLAKALHVSAGPR